MKLTFLGTGWAFTDFRINYQNNVIVDTDDGPVLIDCGATAVQSLRELGLQMWDIAAVVITHLHGDHVAGLDGLLWERFYLTEVKGSMPNWLKTPIWAPRDVHPLLRTFLTPLVDEHVNATGKAVTGGYDAMVDTCLPRLAAGRRPASGWHFRTPQFTVGGVHFHFHPTPHVDGPGVRKPAYGVEVWDDDGRWFYYTSDTIFRADIGDRFPCRIFHDCTFGARYDGTVHTHYEELLTLPDDVRARITLMHHDTVPDGIDVVADGFEDAASRHSSYEFAPAAR